MVTGKVHMLCLGTSPTTKLHWHGKHHELRLDDKKEKAMVMVRIDQEKEFKYDEMMTTHPSLP